MKDLVSVRGAVDLHFHPCRCPIARLLDDWEAAGSAVEAGLSAILIKCHYESTVSRAWLLGPELPDLKISGGIVLNNYVGRTRKGTCQCSGSITTDPRV